MSFLLLTNFLFTTFSSGQELPAPECQVQIDDMRKVVAWGDSGTVVLEAKWACAPRAGYAYQIRNIVLRFSNRKSKNEVRLAAKEGRMAWDGQEVLFLPSLNKHAVYLDLRDRTLRGPEYYRRLK